MHSALPYPLPATWCEGNVYRLRLNSPALPRSPVPWSPSLLHSSPYSFRSLASLHTHTPSLPHALTPSPLLSSLHHSHHSSLFHSSHSHLVTSSEAAIAMSLFVPLDLVRMYFANSSGSTRQSRSPPHRGTRRLPARQAPCRHHVYFRTMSFDCPGADRCHASSGNRARRSRRASSLSQRGERFAASRRGRAHPCVITVSR